MGIRAKSIGLFAFLGVILTGISGVYNEAYAVPIDPPEMGDVPSSCDTLVPVTLDHELGEIDPAFIAGGENIISSSSLTSTTVCVSDGNTANDHLVEITNMSPFEWEELHFVADSGVSPGNRDGGLNAFGGGSGLFRIDGTVTTTGVNDNLIFESMSQDEIFECGETWRFLVTDFGGLGGFSPLPVPFDSVGFSSGSPSGAAMSSASILAKQGKACPPNGGGGGGMAVGGELIPLDTTMVLVAGSQTTAAWMIPIIVAAIGIGIVIARKF